MGKTNNDRVNVGLDDQLHEALEVISAVTGRSKSVIVGESLIKAGIYEEAEACSLLMARKFKNSIEKIERDSTKSGGINF